MAFVLIFTTILWIVSEGSAFHNNEGVINASMQGRSYLDQLLFSVNKYLIKKPVITLILLSSGYLVFREKKLRGIFSLLIIPALIAWFIYGSYNLRLGAHVIAVSALLIAATDDKSFLLPKNNKAWQYSTGFLKKNIRIIGTLLLILIVARSIKIIHKFGDRS